MKRRRRPAPLLSDDGKNVSLSSCDPSLESLAAAQCDARAAPNPAAEREREARSHSGGRKPARRPRPTFSGPLPADAVLRACALRHAPVERPAALADRLLRFRRLNRALYEVVPRIEAAERERWVALVEEMALRRAGNDVSLRLCIAPGTLDAAEAAYMDHRETLLDDARDGEAGGAPEAEAAGDVEEEVDFTSYVQGVLDDDGQKLFLTALFYGGAAPLDSREMLRIYRDG